MRSLKQHKLRKLQRGITSVEFAIAGFATIAILFSAVEMGRLMFTLNTLGEATRRGARVASVCVVEDKDEIARLTIFNSSGTGNTSPILNNLSTDNVVIEYLDMNGTVLPDTTGSNYDLIRYVRVRIVNYQHTFIFPGLDLTFTTPQYPTTVPRESLGVPKPDQTSTCV